MKKLLLISVLTLALFSCKKEPLPDLPDETGPYYSIQGEMDGEEINLNVGQSGILISQGIDIENGVETFYGQIFAPSKDLLVKIEITKPEVLMTATGMHVMNEGNVPFLIHQPGCLTPTFGSNQVQSNFILIKNNQGVYEPATEVAFDEYGVHEMWIDFTDDTQNSFQVPVQYGYDPELIDPNFAAYPLADSVIFSAVDVNGNHEWYIDQDLVSNSASFTTTLPIGIHLVEHKLRDNYGNEAKYTTLVRITDYVLDWKMDMNNCGMAYAPSNFGKVTVTVITNGIEYKSDKAQMNANHAFTVSNIEYIANSSMEPTRLVFDLSFNADLVDDTGTESLSLTNMTGTFNVGLK